MILTALLALPLAASPQQGEAAPSRDDVIRTSVEWLVENQRPSGAWGSHHSPRPIEVLADVPGSHHAFRYAVTALCVMALADSPYQTEESRAALERGVAYLLEDYDVKRPTDMEHYSVWAFGYGLQALAERLLAEPHHPRAADMREVCRHMIQKLESYQALDGGWGYLSLDDPATHPPSFTSMSFTTATILVGIERAQRAGIESPEKMVDRAIRSVVRCETPTGSFTYGELWRRGPARGINQIKGAACRTPLSYEVMALFDRDPGVDKRRRALRDLLIDHSRFQIASLRRPIPHESHYQISGYFYLYGHAYAAYLMERMPLEDQRRFAGPLEQAVLVCRQPDGSFWDYPLYSYHKPYGTAFALIALSRVAAVPGA